MDAISKAKRLQAMKGYKSDRFFYNLIAHSLVALACSLLCFYCSDGFSCLRLSIKNFLFLSFPKMLSSFFCPKWLFVVVNVIVAYLVGESKLFAPKSLSSPAGEIYDEYVERSRAVKGVSALQEKAENSKFDSDIIVEKRVITVVDQLKDGKEGSQEVIELLSKFEDKKLAEEEEEEEEEEGDEEQEQEKEVILEEDDDKEKVRDVEEEEEEEEEEVIGLTAEELNKRVEEFIARVNKQRWLEEKLLVCCKA